MPSLGIEKTPQRTAPENSNSQRKVSSVRPIEKPHERRRGSIANVIMTGNLIPSRRVSMAPSVHSPKEMDQRGASSGAQSPFRGRVGSVSLPDRRQRNSFMIF